MDSDLTMSLHGQEPTAAAQQHMFGLPRTPWEYISSPGAAWSRAIDWLNARWQLRKCTAVGRWTRLRGKVIIQNQGELIIGERVQLLSGYAPSVLAVFSGGRLEIGDRVTVNYGADIAATGLVRIGADSALGTHVIILDNDFHEIADRSRRPEPRPVIIGENVWIGNRAMVLPGVTIGSGAVIGAGSVVMTDVPERSLAIGNPARVIKKL